jgi:hypothetical protein
MDSQHLTPAIGTIGLLGTITLDYINTAVAICVGLMTLVWLGIKIWKELTDEREN